MILVVKLDPFENKFSTKLVVNLAMGGKFIIFSIEVDSENRDPIYPGFCCSIIAKWKTIVRSSVA